MPDLYVITGSNGSGKSTLGFSYLPKIVQNNCPLFDGDKLAMEKRLELYKKVTPSIKEAKRLADEWLYAYFAELVETAIANKEDFAYEGHFADDNPWKTIPRFKRAGYRIHVIFFGLTDTHLSEQRVLERAKQGGHNVPPYEIERNYYGNLAQINKRYKQINELKIIDTSAAIHQGLALFSNGEVDEAIHHGKLPRWFEKYLPKLFRKIEQRDADELARKSHE